MNWAEIKIKGLEFLFKKWADCGDTKQRIEEDRKQNKNRGMRRRKKEKKNWRRRKKEEEKKEEEGRRRKDVPFEVLLKRSASRLKFVQKCK